MGWLVMQEPDFVDGLDVLAPTSGTRIFTLEQRHSRSKKICHYNLIIFLVPQLFICNFCCIITGLTKPIGYCSRMSKSSESCVLFHIALSTPSISLAPWWLSDEFLSGSSLVSGLQAACQVWLLFAICFQILSQPYRTLAPTVKRCILRGIWCVVVCIRMHGTAYEIELAILFL